MLMYDIKTYLVLSVITISIYNPNRAKYRETYLCNTNRANTVKPTCIYRTPTEKPLTLMDQLFLFIFLRFRYRL